MNWLEKRHKINNKNENITLLDRNSDPINLNHGNLIDADSHIIVRRAPVNH